MRSRKSEMETRFSGKKPTGGNAAAPNAPIPRAIAPCRGETPSGKEGNFMPEFRCGLGYDRKASADNSRSIPEAGQANNLPAQPQAAYRDTMNLCSRGGVRTVIDPL